VLPLPGSGHPGTMASQRMTHHRDPNGTVESPVPGRLARRVREATRGSPPIEIPAGRVESTSHGARPRCLRLRSQDRTE
jgi:hypothetical protein